MNASQRRKAYRAMPKAGTQVVRVGTGLPAKVIGPMFSPHLQFNYERANKPSVHRVRVELLGGSHSHPLVRNLRKA